MNLIAQRASDRGMTLVVRDWSHVDWIGFPFTQPTMKSAWDTFSSSARAASEELADQEKDLNRGNQRVPPDCAFDKKECLVGNEWWMARCATVRHPVDQFLVSKRMEALGAVWDDGLIWRGMRAFAEHVQAMPWVRYEDFLHCPGTALRKICDVLGFPYDDRWRQRWQSYDKITGAAAKRERGVIAPKPREAVDPEFWKSLRHNDDFFATLELLGYPTPEPLRGRWYAGAAGIGSPSGAIVAPSQRLPATCSKAIQADSASVQPILGESQSARTSRVRSDRPTDWDEAVVQARQAFEESSGDVESTLRLAEALGWIGQVDEAADLLLKRMNASKGVSQHPAAISVRLFSATCDMLDRGERKYESIPIRRRWAQVDPRHQGNLFQLSILLAGVGETDESISYCRQLLRTDARHTGAAANYLLYMNYSDRYSAAEISNEHFRIGMHFTQPSDAVPTRPRMAAERVRVGYLGSDFYTHPVGKIILPILQSHDRQRCEINVYHDGKISDATTHEINESVDYFTNVHGWSGDRLSESVRKDELDVLVDLGGYTGGANRLKLLARRLAPVQASFLGYPHTSAIPAMDYRLTDRFADPPGLTDHLYGEQLVWLEHAHLAWRPYEIAQDISPVLGKQPVLGVFNNVAKISPAAIAAYAQILKRVPQASILFKYGDRFGVSILRDRYRQAFAAHGVPPHRLQFRTRAETLQEHLQTMANVDLALDAFPYQGTMTSLECLCVGTPIISCCGDYYAHRATSAMFIRMGLQELVADDSDEYVEIAVELLHDREGLKGLRAEVWNRFHHGALTNPHGLAGELESTFAGWVR
ncbi:O-linked N-acetylglucosamine transferase family protein [Allorhodopirellula solitaria]|nr:hypothetical protein [Allorhodopirellula solitaria]